MREVETTRYPWVIREWKKSRMTHRIKLILVGVIGFLLLWWLLDFFGWYMLLGLLPAPAWFMWALRQIDRDSYLLIEVRLEGDEYAPGKRASDSQTNIYHIPPDVWKEMELVGAPYNVGHRTYICNFFQQDEDMGTFRAFFPSDPKLSNMSFYTRVRTWLELKRQLPRIQEELAIYKYGTEEKAMEDAVDILEKIGTWRLVSRGEMKLFRHRKKEAVSNGPGD